MDKKKILKKAIKHCDGQGWEILGPYNPYQKSKVPWAYLIATAPVVPGGTSKI